MICSKLFAGNLPELINEIIQYFHRDYQTLHSCILVNRLWCRLAIPLLWEDPFSIPTRNYHFIEIYLHNLNEEDKTQLNKIGINNNIFPTNTLFNYPSFIKCLKSCKIGYSIEKWITAVRTSIQGQEHPVQITNLLFPHLNFIQNSRLIFKLLFKIFIENEANLHTFEAEIFSEFDCDYFNDAFELILQNPNFINNIKILNLDFDTTFANMTRNYPFLRFLYYNCNSISSLYFQFPAYHADNILTEIYLSQIINSQQNLKKILFGCSNFPLRHSLLSLKNSKCSNTLNTIIFFDVDFKNTNILKEVFEQLNVLESIHIHYCYSLDSDFIQQIINMNKPFKLKSLFMDEVIHIKSLELLFQKSGDYLENFGFELLSRNESKESKQQLLEIITKYCTKIKFLDLNSGLDNLNIYSVFNLIKNIQQNLNYLSIDVLNYYNQINIIELSSIILLNLGQILPFKLEYLNLKLTINPSDLVVFLKNSQNSFIKKLLICNKIQGKIDDILPYIKEYIMKKKRVEYLAIVRTFSETSENLFSLKNEVEEFELNNIQVLNYSDLYIQILDFIKESD
ncbi:hypothetical protein C1645_879840 [Glomus cerebriforme]|uniref:F-box domain-containing protein n=1 Tax=Glomus cerebriforme TaxID=658196 RepID=A0A397SKS7_9GLOM|nr:hypothetical protein C1645_879840 [Glomus cerebriforme]